MLIEIEGIDGAGKTTQVVLLKKWLELSGKEIILVKELETTDLGRLIKEVIVSPKIKTHELEEMFLFLASKAHLISQYIIPSIQSGKIVVGDRGQGSFISYHSDLLEFREEEILQLLKFATQGIYPEITIFIDTPVEIALERLQYKSENSKFDNVGKMRIVRQRDSFLRLARTMPNWFIVDGSLQIKELHLMIVEIIKLKIKNKGA